MAFPFLKRNVLKRYRVRRNVKAPMAPRKRFKANPKRVVIRRPVIQGQPGGNQATWGSKGKFSKRRIGGSKKFNRKVREVVSNQMTADNSFLQNWVDRIVSTGTTNSVAVQAMWAINQAASGGVAASTIDNLIIHDTQFLNVILANISAVQTTQMFVKDWETEAVITNAENTAVMFWEYRCKARRDQPLNKTLDYLIHNGFGNANTGLATQPTYTTLGATPFMNPAITAQYKITSVKKTIIPPGDSITIRYRDKRTKKFTQESINPNGVLYNMLKGQSCSLFVAQGTYATNSSASSTKTQGIGNIDLGIIYKMKCHYSWMNDVSISTGSANYVYGFSAGQSYAPTPIMVVHPDSAIATISTTLGIGTGPASQSTGTRVYATGLDEFAVPDNPED